MLCYMSNTVYVNLTGRMKMENCGLNSQSEFGESENALHLAVSRGELRCTKLLIQAGADVNARRCDGYSVLHTAAARGYTELMCLLLENDAIVNARSEEGETPLHSAVYESNSDCVEILLNHGAFVNALYAKIDMTALHIAANKSPNCIKSLLKKNANLFYMNSRGVCPLDVAMEIGFYRFHCLTEGKLNVKSIDGIMAFHLASHCLNGECLDILLRRVGYEVNATTNKGDTPLHYASQMEKFMECEQDKDQLKSSVIRNIELLLNGGANINKINKNGLTPLHYSVRYGQSFATEHLLKRGANPNLHGGKKNRTPLHLASHGGNLASINFLLKYDADMSAVDRDTNTALMLAAKKIHYPCVRVLLQHDAPLWI